MRAAVFNQVGQPLEIRELPDPTPGPGQVVLRVERCGICGTDLHYTDGSGATYEAGFVPGHESGAEVVAVGAGVDFLKVGDHVVPHPVSGCGACAECLSGSPFWCSQLTFNMGGFGQYKTSGARACIKLPEGLSLADAAIVEPLTCGLHGVALAGVRPGATVLVIGAGPIGLAAIYWARRLGAGRIVAAARSTRHAEKAMTMGADAFLAMDDDFAVRLQEQLGGAPELVFECAGAQGLVARSVELVRPRGTVVVLGMCFHAETFVPATAALKEVTVRFAVGTLLEEFRTVADTLAAGHLEPLAMVTDTVSLDQLPTAFESLRQPGHQCKVLVDPWR
ncbi:alcohol dehydrogenase [Mangrovimicrobium sediminis]|uniref:Alcohol dehydrogenase n=1 Tax=Mangrovimicrobium sediminis TaxID=2562682 RepID=A0A4Z0LYP3_9GAMM|nr:zinc-binding dehydrogenase [Haliea sp. SAOS-164]TGD72296.1 alcohol dehydrogenase [Haliea sp. SAOS-164]